MGFYIEVPENRNKAEQLKKLYHAQMVLRPASVAEIPKDKILVCVVQNGPFDAIGIVFDQRELEDFSETRTGRPRTWMLLDRELVLKLKPTVADVLTY